MTSQVSTSTTAPHERRCGCCGQPRKRLIELGVTPGVFICRTCALWAAGRAAERKPLDEREAKEVSARAAQTRAAIHAELDQASDAFDSLVRDASKSDLRRRSNGTRWSDRQLLFHMVFGYLIVLRLLPLVRLFGRLPDRASTIFAAVLDMAKVPFHVINFVGSLGGGTIVSPRLQVKLMERILWRLHRRIDVEQAGDLDLRMHFPVSWDPFFKDTMTLAEVYHFGTQHFEFHRSQLALP